MLSSCTSLRGAAPRLGCVCAAVAAHSSLKVSIVCRPFYCFVCRASSPILRRQRALFRGAVVALPASHQSVLKPFVDGDLAAAVFTELLLGVSEDDDGT